MSAVVDSEPDSDHKIDTGDHIDGETPEMHKSSYINLNKADFREAEKKASYSITIYLKCL